MTTSRIALVSGLCALALLAVGSAARTADAQTNVPSWTPPSQKPIVLLLSPASGPAGTTVSVRGIGFAPAGNTVRFGNSAFANVASSQNGTLLSFTVPGSLDLPCFHTNPRCAIVSSPYQPGSYPVSVMVGNTESNALSFRLTANPQVIACTQSECGTPPPPGAARLCADGTLVGSSCSRQLDGVCRWTPQQCPDTSCTPQECGPAPGAANQICSDGSIGGPSECHRLKNGSCGYEFRACPVSSSSSSSSVSSRTSSTSSSVSSAPIGSACSCPHGMAWNATSGVCDAAGSFMCPMNAILGGFCGCNGKTYANECIAAADGVKRGAPCGPSSSSSSSMANQNTCSPEDCGPGVPGNGSTVCADGSMSGWRCLRQPNSGACGWTSVSCPSTQNQGIRR